MTSKTFWAGWTFPDEHSEDERILASFPDGVQGWVTGYGDDYTTWCGLIKASSVEEAEEKILSMYGELASHVGWRWEPEEKPEGWTPGSQFPTKD